MTDTEIESSFIINRFNINDILKIIKKKGDKHGFVLKESENQIFSDYYFDNDDLSLGRKKMALRMRIFDNKTVKIALKKTKIEDKFFSERFEIEDYFSENILNSIIKFLKINNLNFENNSIEKIDDINIKIVDQNIIQRTLGLRIIQKRNTIRRSINVYKDSEILYEIAIDDTSFLFHTNTIKCTFMEIESKSGKNTNQKNNELVYSIIDKDKHQLFRIWKFNKLISGFAIDELFSKHKLTHKHIDNHNYLKNAAVDIIERNLQKSIQ